MGSNAFSDDTRDLWSSIRLLGLLDALPCWTTTHPHPPSHLHFTWYWNPLHSHGLLSTDFPFRTHQFVGLFLLIIIFCFRPSASSSRARIKKMCKDGRTIEKPRDEMHATQTAFLYFLDHQCYLYLSILQTQGIAMKYKRTQQIHTTYTISYTSFHCHCYFYHLPVTGIAYTEKYTFQSTTTPLSVYFTIVIHQGIVTLLPLLFPAFSGAFIM